MPSYATIYVIVENHESTVADMIHLFFMSKCLCLFICTLYVCGCVFVCVSSVCVYVCLYRSLPAV